MQAYLHFHISKLYFESLLSLALFDIHSHGTYKFCQEVVADSVNIQKKLKNDCQLLNCTVDYNCLILYLRSNNTCT